MGLSSYYCTFCSNTRRFRFVDEDHQKLVNDSQNGLVTYSDIHICQDGLSAINNLSVDKDYNIRTFDRLKLPEYRQGGLGIPKPSNQQLQNKIEINQSPRNLEIHLLIRDSLIRTQIKLGRFEHLTAFPITTLNSDMGFIEMEVYPTGVSYTPEIEKWLQEFVSILEILPPTLLGLIIESLNYIANNKERPPNKFDINFIKTILASHEVYFTLKDASEINSMKATYDEIISEEDFENIARFIRILKENATSSIRDFTSNPRINMDLISLIYLFNILEDQGVILIERPGIIGQ